MTHFSDTQLWYPPPTMETEHQHHQSFPFFYAQTPNHNPNHLSDNNNNEDSDNSSSNNNRSETASSLSGGRDHMFEKMLTPSDVGKLNRLVVPKQHAERYFPLAGGEKSAGAGGVLLGFEDETGKCWRFRYSYWNSSQSYVLTKGWSRYVKDKKLESGDVVLFERHRFESDRFFIGWRRRQTAVAQPPVQPGGGEGSVYNGVQGYPASHRIAPHPYQPDCFHSGSDMIRQRNQQNDEIQKTPKSGNSKRLRLFGVNLECRLGDDHEENLYPDPEPQTSDGSSLSSHEDPGQGSGHAYVGAYSHDYMGYPTTNHHNQYMAMNIPQDINQMRTRFG